VGQPAGASSVTAPQRHPHSAGDATVAIDDIPAGAHRGTSVPFERSSNS
jgi:hypothetical protein